MARTEATMLVMASAVRIGVGDSGASVVEVKGSVVPVVKLTVVVEELVSLEPFVKSWSKSASLTARSKSDHGHPKADRR